MTDVLWHTVERHGQPPVGSICANLMAQSNPESLYIWRREPRHLDIERGYVRYLPPGTPVVVGELPGWDEVAPPVLSDAEKRAKRMAAAWFDYHRIFCSDEKVAAGWGSVAAAAMRMAADEVMDAYFLTEEMLTSDRINTATEIVKLLRGLADQ